MPYAAVLSIGLTLLGSLSPLLTFITLFQQKEWRLDRLREHLRRDGWANQLFGNVRPILVGIYTLLVVIAVTVLLPRADSSAATNILFMQTATALIIVLLLLAGLSAMQFLLRRQRMPVWTVKALLIALLSYCLTCITVVAFLAAPFLLPVLTLAQPLMVLLAWLLLKPLDALLKRRIMHKAALHRATLTNTTVIGIAGSVGKTTTKELIAHLLQDLQPHVTPARVNTEMGVAQWMTGKQGDLFVVEMGAYAKGEVAQLCRIAQPTIGVMTALGSDHLALFGSEEAIIRANGELISALPATGHAFLYGENDGCKKLAAQAPCPATLTGTNGLHAQDIRETAEGIHFSIAHSPFFIPLHGLHNVHNALLAIGVARHMGMEDKRITELLQTFRPPAHTFNVRTERGVLLLDDTYNISPLSLRAALDWLGAQKARPRTLCTSGLQEAGHSEARLLHELGVHARGKAERVIFHTPHGAKIFERGYGQKVEILRSSTEKTPAGSVLACVGRMPLSSVQRLLP